MRNLRVTWKMASQAEMLDKKALPRPCETSIHVNKTQPASISRKSLPRSTMYQVTRTENKSRHGYKLCWQNHHAYLALVGTLDQTSNVNAVQESRDLATCARPNEKSGSKQCQPRKGLLAQSDHHAIRCKGQRLIPSCLQKQTGCVRTWQA